MAMIGYCTFFMRDDGYRDRSMLPSNLLFTGLAVGALMAGTADCATDRFAWAYHRATIQLQCPEANLRVSAEDEDSGYNIFRVCGCGRSIRYVDTFYYESFYKSSGASFKPVPRPNAGWYESEPFAASSSCGSPAPR
jgi:hypothetical protein